MSRLKTLIDAFNKLPEYSIEIGIPDGQTERDKKKDKKATGKESSLNNAQILFIQENGSPLHHIPARPVLHMTIDWAIENELKPTIKRAVKAYMKSKFNQDELEKEFKKMGERMMIHAQDIIYLNDGRLEPNAPSTIAQKKDIGNHPLFRTGQLARSITYQVTKK